MPAFSSFSSLSTASLRLARAPREAAAEPVRAGAPGGLQGAAVGGAGGALAPAQTHVQAPGLPGGVQRHLHAGAGLPGAAGRAAPAPGAALGGNRRRPHGGGLDGEGGAPLGAADEPPGGQGAAQRCLGAPAVPLTPAGCDSQCLELVEQFGPDELRKVLVTLATQNRRSVPLLRAISYHLVQKPFPLTKCILLDLAYAYGKLGFQQPQVFQRLAADLLPHTPSLTSGEVARCAKSFALLKWLSVPLFEAFVQHVLDRAQTVPVPYLCNVLLAFAHLNFRPEREDQFFRLVHEKLGPALTGLPPALQVDVVWALCVLQRARETELRAVLRPDLHAQFLEGRSPKDQSTFQKLLHINASAQLEHPEYTGPHLPASALVPRLSALDGKVTPLQKELQDTLKGLLGDSSRGSFMVPTQYGWVLDAEVLLDPESQFLPPRDFVAPHLTSSSGSQPLPPGAKRLAFLRWEFPNYGSRSRDLLGRFALARRHVRAAGFLVVDVPYYEWQELRSEWQKGAYLKDKMRKAVAEELAK
uniref:FAST kinase domain-containing protein 4 isoform X2 n=1 Tax=Halichoerus grypus TaxID=9711 RepID=UPI0016591284|nr:FAST kinase domain-containing protein 4 isoform X2 [Halichoerus grypus]